MDIRDYICGLCGEEFGSNCRAGDIECTECGARLCPCCGAWFSEAGDMSEVAPDAAALAAEKERADRAEAELARLRDEKVIVWNKCAACEALEDRAEKAAADERERIKGLFDGWITIALSGPAHPPEAWIAAFADLISGEPQFKIAGEETQGLVNSVQERHPGIEVGLIQVGEMEFWCGIPVCINGPGKHEWHVTCQSREEASGESGP